MVYCGLPEIGTQLSQQGRMARFYDSTRSKSSTAVMSTEADMWMCNQWKIMTGHISVASFDKILSFYSIFWHISVIFQDILLCKDSNI